MTTTVTTASKPQGEKKQGFAGKPPGSRPNPVNVAYEEKMSSLDLRISTAKARLDDLFHGGSGKGTPAEKDARNALFEKVKSLREEIRPHQEARRAMFDQLNRIRDEIRKKTGETKEAKDKLPFRNVNDIETRIGELEAQIETGQFKLIEEKQILAEVSKLKKMRRALENLDGSGSDVGTMKLRCEKLRADIAAKDESIKGYREQLDALQAKLDEMAGNKKEAQAAREERSTNIENIKKEIDGYYEERRKAYEEYRSAKKAQSEAWEKKQARRAEYDRRRELEEKLEDLEEKLLAFNPETANDRKISECNNLKAFFQDFTATQQEKTLEVNKVEEGVRQVKLSGEFANAVPISKKEGRDEFFFAPKSSNRKSHQAAAAQSLSKLPFHILSALADLSLSIPATSAEIPALFEAIEKKKSSFTAKHDDSVVQKEKQREALEKQIEELKKQLDTPLSKPIEQEVTN